MRAIKWHIASIMLKFVCGCKMFVLLKECQQYFFELNRPASCVFVGCITATLIGALPRQKVTKHEWRLGELRNLWLIH